MKLRLKIILCAVVLAALVLLGCSSESGRVANVKSYPINSMAGVLTRAGVAFDDTVTADGNGALRMSAERPTTYRLYETGDVDIENSRLIYRAKIRTENVDGQVYLEMWCHFPGEGAYFSRALNAPLYGTVEWTYQETPFFLKKGENPDDIKLNLVIDGRGTAWIDDITLVRGPL